MNPNRRQFLRLLGAGAAASTGFGKTATLQPAPVVKMDNNYFNPVGLHVEADTTARFEIGAGSHSVTSYQDRIPEGTSMFDNGVIFQGASEHTFETAGTYDYSCLRHKSGEMVGRIVVGNPGGPAEESPISHGNVPESGGLVERGHNFHRRVRRDT